jgi:localization factor PodJL
MGSDSAWNVFDIPSATREATAFAPRKEGVALGDAPAQQIPAFMASGTGKRSEDFDQLRTRLIEVLDRLNHIEALANPDTGRAEVERLHQDLSRLTEDVVRASGHWAIHIAALAADLQNLTATLDGVRAESSSSFSQCRTLLQQGAATHAGQADASAVTGGAHARMMAKLDEVRFAASQSFDALDKRMGLARQNVERLDPRYGRQEQMSGRGRSVLGGDLAEFQWNDPLTAAPPVSRLALAGQTLEQLEQKYRRIAQALSDRLFALDGRLDAAHRESQETLGALDSRLTAIDQALKRLDPRHDEPAQKLADSISSLGDRLDMVLVEASRASSALEQRLGQIAAQSDERHIASKVRHEALSERLEELRLDGSRAAGTLKDRLAVIDQSLADMDHRYDAVALTVTDGMAMLGGKLDAVRSDASRSAAEWEQRLAQGLSGLDEKLGGVRRESSQNAVELEQYLARVQSQLDELHAHHSKMAQNLPAAQARETAAADVASRLELKLANLESHAVQPVADERLANLERRVSELASRTEAAKPVLPALPPEANDAQHSLVAEQAAAAVVSSTLPAASASEKPSTVGPGQSSIASPGNAADPSAELPPFPEVEGANIADPPPFAATDTTPLSAPEPAASSAREYLAAARLSAQAAAEHASGHRTEARSHILPPPAQIFASAKVKTGSAILLGAVGLLAVTTLGLHAVLKGATNAGNSLISPSSGLKSARGTHPGLQRVAAQVHTALPGTVDIASTSVLLHATPVTASDKDTAQRLDAQPRSATTAEAAHISVDLSRIRFLANAGDSRAELILGLYDLRGDADHSDAAQAAKWLQLAAAHGEPVAQYRLGTLYAKGLGVRADAAKAFHWYEAAAKSGNRKAMQNLAIDCVQGHGTAKDPARAVRWFTQAAELGLVDAQFNLAVLHEQGLGVSLSLPDAYRWFGIAAKYGDLESKVRVDALSAQIPESDRAAAEKAIADFKLSPMDAHANAAPDLPST